MNITKYIKGTLRNYNRTQGYEWERGRMQAQADARFESNLWIGIIGLGMIGIFGLAFWLIIV